MGESRPLRVLLIEDSNADAELVSGLLASLGPKRYRLTRCASLNKGLKRLASKGADAVLLDLGLPDSSGLRTIERLRRAAPHAPVVILTELDHDGMAVESARRGTEDYLLKRDLDSRGLDRALRSAVERRRIVTDLEHRCENEAQRARLRAQLDNLVSHEFANAMSVVQCALGFLEQTESGGRPATRRQMYDIIRKNVQSLDLMSTNLLSAGRMESGKFRLQLERTDPALVMRSCHERLEALCRKKDLRVELALPAEPPPVRADAEALGLVFSNLLMNAIKYTPAGGRIEAGVGPAPRGRVLLYCRDTGIGMSAKEKGRLFSEGFRGASARKAANGFGLGLVLVRDIVRMHGGELAVETARHGGSTFSFTLAAWKGR